MTRNGPPMDSQEDFLIEVGATPAEESPLLANQEPPPGTPADSVSVPGQLPVLPLRDSVLFPGTIMPLKVLREQVRRVLDAALAGSRMVCAVAQRHGDVEKPMLENLHRVGTACTILRLARRGQADETMILQGVSRVGIVEVLQRAPFLVVEVLPRPDYVEPSTELEALVHSVRSSATRAIELSPHVSEEALETLDGIPTASGLADFLAANLALPLVNKQELLETFDVKDRLKKVNQAVVHQIEILEISDKIQEQVRSQVDRSQREYFLREQLKAIQGELGLSDARSPNIEKYAKCIAEAKMPDAVQQEARRELARVEAIPPFSPEYTNAIDYLDWLCSLPWSTSTEDRLDIKRAAQILDEDHYGLEKVKRRMLEFLAVRKLKPQGRGPILCFIGPPGVGKTSLGQSVARALGRKFVRISLGGVHDEAEIRGHRRTYIGALPGRIIQELRKAGSNNPVFMMDEVDKLGRDFRGDPASALLEVLDPAQNATFTDRYLDVPFDLSRVLFITTANYVDAIPGPLRDRMEVLELCGYTDREKLEIAQRYLIPRQLAEHGLNERALRFESDAVSAIISHYAVEAGVRELERKIGAICRARAAAIVAGAARQKRVTPRSLHTYLGPRNYEPETAADRAVPGVVTGLAYTPQGGDILFIEANWMPGVGRLKLTGHIGDVMRESAEAAFSVVKGRSRQLGIGDDAWARLDFHIHVPAGATPKDGPSAGIAIFSALTSLISGRAVDPRIGMTGEITLRGALLPVGGIREKILAAHRAKLQRVILPRKNLRDLEELPEDVRQQLTFVPVDTIDALIRVLFESSSPKRPKTPRRPKAASRADKRTAGAKKKNASAKRPRSAGARRPKRVKVKRR